MRLSLPFHEIMCTSLLTAEDMIPSFCATDLGSMNRIALWLVEGCGEIFLLSSTWDLITDLGAID